MPKPEATLSATLRTIASPAGLVHTHDAHHLRALADQAEAMEQRCERQTATIADLERCARQSAVAREEQNQEIRRLRAELNDANANVVAFCSVWAVTWAHDHGLPPGHLHPVHYDVLAKAGARMDDFTRAALEGK